jgi:hypothetical protein
VRSASGSHNETDASEIADFLVALEPVFVRIFFESHVRANRPVDAKTGVTQFLSRGAKSNGEKDVVGRNHNRGLLLGCHIRPAVAYTSQGSRRVPWHMQPARDLLRRVFLLQGIMRE